MRRTDWIFFLALLMMSLLNCEDVQMANQRPVIGARAGAQNTPDPNDVLLRNIEIAKLRMAFSDTQGVVWANAGPELAYKNNISQNALMHIEPHASIGSLIRVRYGKNDSTSFRLDLKGIYVNLVAYSAEQAFVLLLPGEEIWMQVSSGYATWQVVLLNNLF